MLMMPVQKGRTQQLSVELPAESLLVPAGLLLALLNNPPGVERVKLAPSNPSTSTGYSRVRRVTRQVQWVTRRVQRLTRQVRRIHDRFLKIRENPTSVPCSAAYTAAGSKTPGLATSPRSYPPCIARQRGVVVGFSTDWAQEACYVILRVDYGKSGYVGTGLF